MFIFSGHQWSVSPKSLSRYRSAFLSATNWKHWFSALQNFILFKLNLQKNPEPMRLKNIQTCYPLHSKIHILSVNVWKERWGKERKKKKEREQSFSYWLSGRYATQLVQTTKRGRGGGEWDNPKNKKLSVENLEHFPKYTNFPDEHIS